MCVREGYIEVVDWWKSVELIELMKDAAYRDNGECWIICTRMQEACSDLREFLNGSIVNCTASGGQIKALEWAWDRGMHGGAESCMFAAHYGHLHVLQWLREDGATWDSGVIFCADEHGYNYVIEWARENGCPEP
jgi:diadenosine tetraphosphatase ApaH/serine/threonine PP2A family protein phosphatase